MQEQMIPILCPISPLFISSQRDETQPNIMSCKKNCGCITNMGDLGAPRGGARGGAPGGGGRGHTTHSTF